MTAEQIATRDRILDAAIALFGDRGFDGVSTSDIAEAAGVNKALIFYHFTSKQELFTACITGLMSSLAEELRTSMVACEPGLATIEAFVRTHIGFLGKHPTLARMIGRELIASHTSLTPASITCLPVLLGIRNHLLKAIETAREKGEIRDVDPVQTIVSILSLDIFFFLGMPMLRILASGDIDLALETSRVDHVVDLLLNGLKNHTE